MKGAFPRPFLLAVDGSPFLGPEPTGVARLWAGLLEALGQACPELQLTVYFPRPPASPPPVGRPVVVGGGKGYWWRALPRCLRRDRPHLFHSPYTAVPVGTPVPAVATLHEVPDRTMLAAAGLLHTLRQRLWWAVARRRAAGAMAVSVFTARSARRSGWRRPLVVVRPGVPTPVKPVTTGRGDFLLGLGRISRRKGVALAAAAAAAVRRELRWAGPGKPLPGGGKVRFLGYVDEATRTALLAEAACLLLPSRLEGFGLPALEALAAGCPVVVSDAGALPEVVGRAGWVVGARTPAAWAATLRAVLGDRAERERRVRLGLQRARRFTWPRAARRLLRLYAAVLKVPPPPPAGPGPAAATPRP